MHGHMNVKLESLSHYMCQITAYSNDSDSVVPTCNMYNVLSKAWEICLSTYKTNM